GYDPRLRFFDQAQNQVLNRLDEHLHTENGVSYLGRPNEDGIKLVYFKKKDRKDREREIIKLLHKSDNLVEEIYDRIGFRLVTETKFDAIRAVRLMLEKNIISVPNIRPGRSRNRLIDLSRLQFEIDRIDSHIKKSGESAPYVEKMIKRLENRIGFSRLGRSLINPHTSEHYKSIQFTCRELVKIRNPVGQVYAKLKEPLSNLHGGQQVLAEVFPEKVSPSIHVFFPYEIQIMDVKAYADSIFGKSSHEEYRRKQLETARDRVFGRNLAKKK
ncbi:TIGR04552 family protein, partial [bacterium]|nr:TIGR04552 family protein [bacterium]